MKKPAPVAFEDALYDDWDRDLGIVEVPLDVKPFWVIGIVLLLLGGVAFGRVVYLSGMRGTFYRGLAEANAGHFETIAAPRGEIVDRNGEVLAENKAAYNAVLDMREFVTRVDLRDRTIAAIRDLFGVSADRMNQLLGDTSFEKSVQPLLIASDLSQDQIVQTEGLNLPTVRLERGFERVYPGGSTFSSVLGYTGFVTEGDIKKDSTLTSDDMIGKTGFELAYDNVLRGTPGISVELHDAKGKVLGQEEKELPQIGTTQTLTIDGGLQVYFHDRLAAGLASLGRTSGAGIAIDPQTGEILALVNFPDFDNNLFAQSGRSSERLAILNSPLKPLFDRAVSGLYNPGSTIKPLVGVAALAEHVIDPSREIFSPGYLDVPNPYRPQTPTRFLDWRYQGNVNLAGALAQSSNVYFYTVGGGANGINGLGIDRLHSWWQKFRLGQPTGVDLPNEGGGLLPTPEWKESAQNRAWLLGDTYNVSIGQGDLLITPLQLINYIGAIANNGKLYRPYVNAALQPQTIEDLGNYLSEIKEVQKGMARAVTNPLGTAYLLRDLPFSVGAKTGSAQVKNNAEENAFFVGYAPYDNPKIAILVLIENSKEGSLNAVPIAKDVLKWYYKNRIIASPSLSQP